MGAVNKFGKICGPGAQATPAANSVTTDKIFDGTIATADLGAKSVTAATLGVDVAGDGLTGGNGAAIDLDIDGLTAAAVAVSADSFPFLDATDSGNKLESFVDLATAMAGTVAATGMTAASGVLKCTPSDTAIAVAADSFVFSDATDGATRKDLVSDVATAMADGTTITAAAGVFSVGTDGVGILQHANDDKHSIFFVAGEIDFGESNAVTVDLGAIGSKATLIGGYWTVTEAVANGDATSTVKLGTATGGGSTISSDLTVTLANTADGQSNTVGMMRAILPNGSTSVDMASTTHLWLDCADDVAGTRSAGKVKVFCLLQKSA